MALFLNFSRRLGLQSFRETRGNYIINKFSSNVYSADKDPAPVFFNGEVQKLLRSLTRVNFSKVFRKRRTGEKKLERPVYQFMTDEQLTEAREEANRTAEAILQMPPILSVRMPIDRVVSDDPALQGLNTARLVFTDITFGKKNSERIILVREPDGKLKDADWSLRDRMNQVYFPLNGRELKVPGMFEDEHLKNLLEANEYEYILDRACIQFEPNDAVYQKLTSTVYDHINKNNNFDRLRSTRHFGPLAFYLAWFKMADNLLLELIETNHMDDAIDLIKLYGKMHELTFESGDVVGEFISKHSNKKGPLELAVQAYRELEKQRTELEMGVQAAHGRV